ncbi:hypothetical protein L7F22_005302 [Adiantum nelumboides]|nr:hypothetical protein [Adiantum nelumboides]
MLQQPSELITYQKFPLDLNMHSAEVSNLQPDFKDIGLQLQAQRAAVATQAFFLDAYCVKAAVPSAMSSATAIEALRPGISIPGAYAYPFQAAYDPILKDRQHHLPQQQQKPHHQLQIHKEHLQQNHVPKTTTSSAELWQQQQLEKRGCWFPNWQDVFQGFAAPREEKHGTLSSLQPQSPKQGKQGLVSMPSAARMVNVTEDRQLNVHPDGVDPKPLLFPSPKHDAEPLPHVKGADFRHLDRADSSGLSDLRPMSSQLATAIVPFTAPSPEWRSESSLAPCTDSRDPSLPPSGGNIACRYITQSPAWLPPGWITEVQTRRSGTTAGTRDKYYKDLVSGRRFRSKNEVIYYLQTGKGRFRRCRRRKAIASSGFGGHCNYLSHQPHSSAQQETPSPRPFLTPEPIGFVLGPLVNTQTANSMPLVPPVVSQSKEASVQAPAASLNASTNHLLEEQSSQVSMFGPKRPVESRPQKLPVHKKAKILAPNKCEDKQASRLWQWLHKPARTDELPQQQDAQAQEHGSMVEQKKAPNIEDSGREFFIEQRTAQVSKDVEAAQRTIIQLGKEMQATLDKLTQRVGTARRDLKPEADAAMKDVVQATQRLDNAVGNLSEATQGLVSALGSAVHASQSPSYHVGMASLPVKQPQAAAAGVVLQRALRPDVAIEQSVSSSYTAHLSARENAMQACSFCDDVNPYASESSQGPDKLRACDSQSMDARVHHALEPSHWPDSPGARMTQAAQLSDVFALYAIQQAQRPDLAMRDPTKIPQCSTIIANYASAAVTTSMIVDATGATQKAEKLNGGEHAYQKALDGNTEARSLHIHRFPVLNPELDLSLLSPNLNSRQRAKEVQKMKAKHARGLLVILGRKLCHEAIQKSCEEDIWKDY